MEKLLTIFILVIGCSFIVFAIVDRICRMIEFINKNKNKD